MIHRLQRTCRAQRIWEHPSPLQWQRMHQRAILRLIIYALEKKNDIFILDIKVFGLVLLGTY